MRNASNNFSVSGILSCGTGALAAYRTRRKNCEASRVGLSRERALFATSHQWELDFLSPSSVQMTFFPYPSELHKPTILRH
eukprot:scaffold9178_cov176-Amphora_coffeaeformis.AAC.2